MNLNSELVTQVLKGTEEQEDWPQVGNEPLGMTRGRLAENSQHFRGQHIERLCAAHRAPKSQLEIWNPEAGCDFQRRTLRRT